MIKKSWRKRVVPDGRVYEFDLKSGRLVENGKESFKIKVKADYTISNTTKDYPWTVFVQIEEGGIVETEDPYLYLAPESGYESSLS